MGACFHDAGPGSNAKTSVHRTAVKPTGRLRRASADVARETFRSTCSPTCAEKSTGTNKSSPQEPDTDWSNRRKSPSDRSFRDWGTAQPTCRPRSLTGNPPGHGIERQGCPRIIGSNRPLLPAMGLRCTSTMYRTGGERRSMGRTVDHPVPGTLLSAMFDRLKSDPLGLLHCPDQQGSFPRDVT